MENKLSIGKLEEAAENYGWRIKKMCFSDKVKANELAESAKQDFIEGVKWQQERSYSEEEVIEILKKSRYNLFKIDETEEWFEQFKKKE